MQHAAARSGRARAGGSGGAEAKNVRGWETPVAGGSGGGSVRRAWFCCKGAPLGAERGAEKDGAAAGAVSAVGAGKGRAESDGAGLKNHDDGTATARAAGDSPRDDHAAAVKPRAAAAASNASGGEENTEKDAADGGGAPNDDAAMSATIAVAGSPPLAPLALKGLRPQGDTGPPRHGGGGGGAIVTPPRSAPAEAAATVSPAPLTAGEGAGGTGCKPGARAQAGPRSNGSLAAAAARNDETGEATSKQASEGMPRGGGSTSGEGKATTVVAALSQSSSPRASATATGGQNTPAARAMVVAPAHADVGAHVHKHPHANGREGVESTVLRPVASGQVRVVRAAPAVASVVSGAQGAPTKRVTPPPSSNDLTKGTGRSVSTANEAAARPRGPPGSSPAAAWAATPAVGVVTAPGTLLPAVGVVRAPGPRRAPSAGGGPMQAVGIVEAPGPMQAVGIVEAPRPCQSRRPDVNIHRGGLQAVRQKPPTSRFSTQASAGGVCRPRSGAIAPGWGSSCNGAAAAAGGIQAAGGVSGGHGGMIDEVALRLATVSEALTLLEEVAILPQLRRMSRSVRVDVKRRPEMRAKADWANRVERVSA